MAGCSKDTPVDPNLEPWVSDLNLPVPVELGANGFQFETKAEKVDNNNLDKATLRLFAIDKSSLGDTVIKDKSILFLSENAKYNKTDGTLQFDEGKVWYYPYASANNYTFYAYYAGEKELQLRTAEGVGLCVQLDLNENQSDILWAKAQAEVYAGMDGFNAKYIRKVTADNQKETYYPKLEFQHLTTALTFQFQTEAAGNETAGEQLKHVKIDSLKITNLPRKVNLWITGDRQGTLKEVAKDKQLGVEMDCGDGISPGEIGTSTLGTMFVFVPEDTKSIMAQMWVSVPESYIDGEYQYSTIQVDMDLKAKDKASFLTGHEYTYTIIMKPSYEIEIKATVKDWQQGDAGEDSSASIDGSSTGGGLVIE